MLVFDLHYMCWRAHFSTGGLSNSYGESTEIIHGVLDQVFRISNRFEDKNIVFASDSKREDLRRRLIFDGYKRRESGQIDKEAIINVINQINKLKSKILPYIGFNNIFEQSGYEADDIISVIVRDFHKDHEITIISADTDLYQLLRHAKQYSPREGTTIDARRFISRYGISPEDWATVKAISGCNSDTIPGVKGVAEKTAIKYITGALKPDSKKYIDIENSRDIILRNKLLVTLPFDEGCNRPDIDQSDRFNHKRFMNICKKYELNKIKETYEEWRI